MRQIRKKLHVIMRSHAFLWRLTVCAILLVCIPVLYSSLTLSRKGYQSLMQETEQNTLQLANSVALKFEELIESLDVVTHHYLETSGTYLQWSLASEADAAVDTLKHYLNDTKHSLPTVQCAALYFVKSGLLYSNNGLEQPGLFFRTYFPKMTTPEALELLTSLTSPRFLANDSRYLTYLAPVSFQTGSANRRVAVFVMSDATLRKSMSLLLPSHCTLAGLYDGQGSCLYRAADSGVSVPDQLPGSGLRVIGDGMMSLVGSGGAAYSAMLAVEEEAFLQRAHDFTASMTQSNVILLVVIVLLIATVIWITYSPVRQLLHAAQPSGDADAEIQNEFTTIKLYIDDQRKMREELQLEADEQRALYRAGLYEKLLYGIRLPPEQIASLSADGSFLFCVAVAPLASVRNINRLKTLVSGLRSIYLLELYDSGYAVFVGSFAPEQADDEHRAQLFGEIAEKASLPLGVSNFCLGLSDLHVGYIEAVTALPDRGVGYAVVREPGRDQGERLSVLRRTLPVVAERDAVQASAMAGEIFDGLDRQYPSQILRQRAYAEFIADFYREARKRNPNLEHGGSEPAELPFGNLAAVRDRFCDALRSVVLPDSVSRKVDEKAMMQFIGQHLFEPSFGLASVADAFHITDYTASRLLKAHIGMSFKKYMTMQRIEEAKGLLLTTDLKMCDIAARCGFASASYFARVFQSEEGMPPAQYRQLGLEAKKAGERR